MSRPIFISSALGFGLTLASPLAALAEDATTTAAPSTPSESPAPATPSAGPPGPEAAPVSAPEATSGSAKTAPSEAASAESSGTGTPAPESAPDETKSEPAVAAPSSESQKAPPAPYDGPATLIDGDGEKMHVGGYGGLSVLGTSIYKSGGLLVGGEGAILLDHRLAIGLAGFGLASEVKGPDLTNGEESILGFGYGGAVFRYHLVSKRSPVTASLGTLIGAGGLTLIEKSTSDEFDPEYDYSEDAEANAFFVAEPSVQANLHLTRWMRLGVSGGYRFVRGPTLRGVSDEDLEGVTAGGHLQFGWF
jgi:hypothetical protein